MVGHSLEQAVYRAIYTEMNAKLQKEAHALGEPDNEEEASQAAITMDATMSRPWNLWKAEGRADHLRPLHEAHRRASIF